MADLISMILSTTMGKNKNKIKEGYINIVALEVLHYISNIMTVRDHIF